MTITADILRRIAALQLPPDKMQAVIEIIAELQEADDSRRAKQRDRARKSRTRSRDGDVTVTPQERTANDTVNVTVTQSAQKDPLSPKPPIPEKPKEKPPLTGGQKESSPSAKLEGSQLDETLEIPEVCLRGRALPADWQPTEADFAYGAELGFSREQVASEAEDMRLWAQANRNRAVARKANWTQAFQGWLRREAKKAKQPNSGGNWRDAEAEATRRFLDA